MVSPRNLLPVADPYQARILVNYLAEAFNPAFGRTRDIPPVENPLWPTACRMVEAMTRDNYQLASRAVVDGQYGPRRHSASRR